MRYIKTYEDISTHKFKVGDIVRILEDFFKGKLFEVSSISMQGDEPKYSLDQINSKKNEGHMHISNKGEQNLELVPEWEIDANKYNL